MFNSFLERVVRYELGSRSITHYLDDFLFMASGGPEGCRFLLDTFRFRMSQFGVLSA